MLRRPTAKSKLHRRLEKTLPWVLFGIVVIGVLLNAFQTIQYRTEEQLAEKRACQDGTADTGVNCAIYLGPRWTSQPVATQGNNLSDAP